MAKLVVVFFFWATFLFPSVSSAGEQPWESIGIGGRGAFLFAQFDIGNPRRIIAGSDMGAVVASDNLGEKWYCVGKGLTSKYPQFLYQDKERPGRLFVGAGCGLYESRDSGNTWRDLTFARTDLNYPRQHIGLPISGLAIGPADKDHFLASVGLVQGDVWDRFCPKEYRGLLLESKDAGRSWISRRASGVPRGLNYRRLVAHPADPKTLCLVTDYGLYVSRDFGGRWTPLGRALSNQNFSDLAFNPADPQIMVAVTSGSKRDSALRRQRRRGHDARVWMSKDGGNTWKDVGQSFEPGTCGFSRALFDPSGHIIYLGNRAPKALGLYQTVDEGKTWSLLTSRERLNASHIHNLSILDVYVDAERPQRILLCAMSHVYLSEDAGKHWRQLATRRVGNGWRGTGLESTVCTCVALDPSNANVFYMGHLDVGLTRTRDGGRSLEIRNAPVHGPPSHYPGRGTKWGNVFALVLDPADSSVLYASNGNWGFDVGVLCVSYDGADTWRVIGEANRLPNSNIADIAIPHGQQAPSQEVWVGSSKGIFQSLDGGSTWRAVDTALRGFRCRAIAFSPAAPNRILAAFSRQQRARLADSQVLLSTDRGGTWHRVGAYPARQIVFNPRVADEVWLAALSKGIYKSVDGGRTFKNLLTEACCTCVAVDPQQSSRVLAGLRDPAFYGVPGKSGVLESLDGGSTWHVWQEAPLFPVMDIAFAPDSSVLLATSGYDTVRVPPVNRAVE